MAARRETWRERVSDTIRFVVLPNWKIVPLIFVLALVGYLLIFQSRMAAERPTTTTEARIVRFGFHADPRTFAPSSVAIVRLPDGTTTEVFADPSQMARCRAGDRITYTRGPLGMQIDRCTS